MADRPRRNGRATTIIPELQHIAIGDILPATPRGADGFAVLRVEPSRRLVLGSPSLLPDAAAAPSGMFGATYAMTWAFYLELIDDEATIKEFQRSPSVIVLKPRSHSGGHRPVVLTKDFQIQGVVVSAIPKF